MRIAFNIISILLLLAAAGFIYMASETNRYWDERTK